MKLHFGLIVVTAALMAIQAVVDSPKTRMYYLAIMLVTYLATYLLFVVEYDKEMIKKWKAKEQKLRSDRELNLIKKYYAKKYNIKDIENIE